VPTAEDLALQYDEMEARLTAPVSERMLDLAGVREGMRVLDLASGRGEPALRAARRVGPTGHVLGVDLQDALLEVARVRAKQGGLANVELRVTDAEEVDEVARGFDVAMSRWGLMYMASPVRALSAVRRALVPGGCLVVALWIDPERASWWSVPRRATSRFAELPPVSPDGPSPFRYAAHATIARDFSDAGFAITQTEEREIQVVEAEDGAGIVAWVRAVLGRWAALVPESARGAWEAEVAREAEAHRDGAMLRLGGVTRIVVARAAEVC
jgi:ubiquinone/menaquinone biosynthesis C-methylase UbiE